MKANLKISSVANVELMIENPHPYWLAYQGKAILERIEFHVKRSGWDRGRAEAALIIYNACYDLKATMEYLNGIQPVLESSLRRETAK